MAKKFFTYEQQLHKLQQEKDLIIPDTDAAKLTLEKLSYSFTFGQVSKMFQYITNDVQYKISQKFEHITERELHQFITVLARCRNVCAHGERLFSFRIHETIPNTLLHKKLQISQKNGNYLYGKQDLFAVVIALRYLIGAEDFKVFKSDLTSVC